MKRYTILAKIPARKIVELHELQNCTNMWVAKNPIINNILYINI